MRRPAAWQRLPRVLFITLKRSDDGIDRPAVNSRRCAIGCWDFPGDDMHHHAGDLLDDRKALQERSWPVLLDEAYRRFVQWLAVLQDELLHESFADADIARRK